MFEDSRDVTRNILDLPRMRFNPAAVARDLLLVLTLFLCGATGAYFGLHSEEYSWSATSVTLVFGVSSTLFIILLWSFFSNGETRNSLLLALLGVAAALYLTEIFLFTGGDALLRLSKYDRRTKLEIIADLKVEGVVAYPSINSKLLPVEGLSLGDERILPLGGIPSVYTIVCNEAGQYYNYLSDEHGFNNPSELWNAAAVEMALVGDSFTQGFCVPHGRSYADLLRTSYPGVLNLGISGNGPLTEFASIREYLSVKKPAHVVWFFFEGNDFEDLARELRHPILRRYFLEKDFSQKLLYRAEGIASVLQSFARHQVDLASSGLFHHDKIPPLEKIRLVSRLWHVRRLLGLTELRRRWPPSVFDESSVRRELQEAFKIALKKSKELVTSWGGRLYFVYLPAHRTLAHNQAHPMRQVALESARSLEITTVDILPLFASHHDPLSLFPFRQDAHYTEEGNRLVAEAVRKATFDDGILSK